MAIPGQLLTPNEVSWMRRVPRPGTVAGTQKRNEFIAGLHSVSSDFRFLQVPRLTDGATLTEDSPIARTVTAVATPASAPQGSGVRAILNGTSQYYTAPDTANLSFGNATADSAFSIVAWVNITNTGAIRDILAKLDGTTGVTKREFEFYIDSSDLLTMNMWDESAGAYIGRSYSVAITQGSMIFVAMTYDATEASSGIKLYRADGTNALALDLPACTRQGDVW